MVSITGHRRYDDLTLESSLYEQVFDTAFVGICFMKDRQFLRVNRCMEEMLGYPLGGLAGQSVRTVYARQEDFDDVGKIIASFPRQNNYVHERPLLTRTGRLRWCLISGRMLDPMDPDSASVWVVQDISERKRTEAALARATEKLEQTVRRRTVNLREINQALQAEVARRRISEGALVESREKYRVLFRKSSLGIVIADESGTIVEMNPAMQTIFHARNLENFLDIASRPHCFLESKPVEYLSVLDAIRSISDADVQNVRRMTLCWNPPTKDARWFEVSGIGMRGHGLRAAVSFDDRTEQRRARERDLQQRHQLAQTSRISFLGHFAAALAHELGQPLNAALSYAGGIEKRVQLSDFPDVEVLEAVGRLQRQLEQAGDVVGNVRSFIASHLPQREPVDLIAITHNIMDLMRLQFRDLGARVELEAETDSAIVEGSRIEIQQVLMNLLLNSLEATRDAATALPEVAVAIHPVKGTKIEVSVADNGPGVPASVRDRIFQPYLTTKAQGMGLGLMMCRTIIESHGGKLWLDKRRRIGADFRFTLPLRK